MISSQDRKTNSLVRFLEEVLAGNFALEIYWPLSECPNNEEDCANFCGLLRKAEL